MSKIANVKHAYLLKGISEDNILYAIDAVKSGTRREQILENLTADYRGVSEQDANVLIEDLFKANGGEFKYENRLGYLYGSFSLLIGLPLSFYIWYVFTYGGVLIKPVLVFGGAILFTLSGIVMIGSAVFGRYRQKHEDADYY